MSQQQNYPMHSVEEEVASHCQEASSQQAKTTYELAFLDQQFLLQRELRPVRLQLEYLKAEMKQLEQGIQSTVVIFGGARIASPEQAAQHLQQAQAAVERAPEDPQAQRALQRAEQAQQRSGYYQQAQELGYLITEYNNKNSKKGTFVVMTGGGPGIMEAANRGAKEACGPSLGLNIYLPKEQGVNEYVSPGLNLEFHYFALRKMHFLNRARALVFFPGGFGTLDELFEVLTLMQTQKMKPVPVLLFHEPYWRRVLNLHVLVEEEAIEPADLELFQYVETAEQAWQIIDRFYGTSKQTAH